MLEGVSVYGFLHHNQTKIALANLKFLNDCKMKVRE